MTEFGSQLKVVMDGIKVFEESLAAQRRSGSLRVRYRSIKKR